MNNPLSSRPDHVLYPLPHGCTGNRLWQMLHAETGARMRDYLATFERRNLVVGKWDAQLARQGAVELLAQMGTDRRVVLLGAEVRRAFGHAKQAPAMVYAASAGDSNSYYQIPHPSGRNLWYNDLGNRAVVARLLAELYRISTGEMTP